MLKKLSFAYLSTEDPRNKKVWSGTHYAIYSNLLTIGTVDILGPYTPRFKLFISKFINQFYLKLFNKRFGYRHSIFISKALGDYFNEKLKLKKYDYIIAPAASAELAFLVADIPVIYITDGTFTGCVNYHKSLSKLTTKSIIQGNLVEQRAINNSAKIIVSSDWAAKSVINDYNAPPKKVSVIPYGANFDILPFEQDLVFEKPSEWKLLFVGVYWENKGGDIAFNAFVKLREEGYNVSLTIVGCIPPSEVKDDKLNVIPFIDKNEHEGQKKLSEIYAQHHILLLPTRFDCSPIVINEASAFGMPCIVADTGGVQGHLREGVNGYLVDYSDRGEKYAHIISELITNPLKYISLRQSSRKEYVERLNWHHWINEFKKIIS